jgi:hypothetical protein
MPTRTVILPVLALLFGLFVTVYGGLLASSPDLFLRFHDTFVARGEWNMNAPWRRNVGNRDYAVLGVLFSILGLLLTSMMAVRLISLWG